MVKLSIRVTLLSRSYFFTWTSELSNRFPFVHSGDSWCASTENGVLRPVSPVRRDESKQPLHQPQTKPYTDQLDEHVRVRYAWLRDAADDFLQHFDRQSSFNTCSRPYALSLGTQRSPAAAVSCWCPTVGPPCAAARCDMMYRPPPAAGADSYQIAMSC